MVEVGQVVPAVPVVLELSRQELIEAVKLMEYSGALEFVEAARPFLPDASEIKLRPTFKKLGGELRESYNYSEYRVNLDFGHEEHHSGGLLGRKPETWETWYEFRVDSKVLHRQWIEAEIVQRSTRHMDPKLGVAGYKHKSGFSIPYEHVTPKNVVNRLRKMLLPYYTNPIPN